MNVETILQDFQKKVIKDNDIKEINGIKFCAKCNTPREVIFDINTGERHSCLCLCQAEERDRLINSFNAEKEINATEYRRKEQLPFEDLRNARIEKSIDKESKAYRVAVGFVKDFEEHGEKGVGILFYGETGSGKTFMEAAIGNALIDKGFNVLFANASELITLFDSGNGEKIAYEIKKILNADLFILDDLGSERATDTALSKMYQIVNSRYMTKKSMLVSTNLSIEQMKNTPNGNQQRMFSRIFEICYPVKMEGNKRKDNAQNNFEKFKNY